MARNLFKILIGFILSPVAIIAYLFAWLYIAAWIGWYWGIDNATKLMVDKAKE